MSDDRLDIGAVFGRYLTAPEAEALGYTVEHILPDGRVRSMATSTGYAVVYGAPSYMQAVMRANRLPASAAGARSDETAQPVQPVQPVGRQSGPSEASGDAQRSPDHV